MPSLSAGKIVSLQNILKSSRSYKTSAISKLIGFPELPPNASVRVLDFRSASIYFFAH
jgi:hypothetical protein